MNAVTDIGVACGLRHKVGESPLWVEETGCLWWVDAGGREVRRLNVASGALDTFLMPASPSALALDEDGRIVVAAGLAWYSLDADAESVALIARLEGQAGGVRLNDGATDSAGRFWVGTLSTSPEREPVGHLHYLERGEVGEVFGGLRTQNGAAVSPDGRTFYLADSHPEVATIWAFDFDVESATLSNRRVFHRPERGRPDGAAVDAEGCYWFAAVDGGQVVRLDPKGRVMSAIDLPVSRPTKPAFGGADLSTLYITTMSAGLDEAALASQPLAGAVLEVDADVRGWPLPRARTAFGNGRIQLSS